jgi:hypothetical protein
VTRPGSRRRPRRASHRAGPGRLGRTCPTVAAGSRAWPSPRGSALWPRCAAPPAWLDSGRAPAARAPPPARSRTPGDPPAWHAGAAEFNGQPVCRPMVGMTLSAHRESGRARQGASASRPPIGATRCGELSSPSPAGCTNGRGRSDCEHRYQVVSADEAGVPHGERHGRVRVSWQAQTGVHADASGTTTFGITSASAMGRHRHPRTVRRLPLVRAGMAG